ncbi:MAG: transposase [Planctomycetota bacterium]|nr:MAG: transposase [Planctomycetota bacterium]
MPGRLKRHDEYGHTHFLTISCYRRLQFFRHDSVKKVFIEGIHHTREKLGIRWIGYVIMPEHIHLLIFPQPNGSDTPIPVSQVLHELKQYVGRHGKKALRKIWSVNRSLGTPPLDAWALGQGPKPFWKPRGYDFNTTREDTIHEKLDYMHKNPITRGLVDRAELWPWSSYRYYELSDYSLIEMDWDGSWPIA